MSDERKTSSLTPEQWLNIAQIRELVKHEGDVLCEVAFDDLSAELAWMRAQLAESAADLQEVILESGEWERRAEALKAQLAGLREIEAAARNLALYDDLTEPPCDVCAPDAPTDYTEARLRLHAALATEEPR